MSYSEFLHAKTQLGRKGIGVELKPSYYRQAVKNLDAVNRKQLSAQTTFELDTDKESAE